MPLLMTSLKAAWRLIRPFWFSQDRWKALALLTGAIGSHVGLTMVGVGFNLAGGRMFNAIQDHDLPAFLAQLLRWGELFAGLLVAVACNYLFTQLLSWLWRGWMTRHLVDRWMCEGGFVRMPLLKQGGDNPDQRIAEDVALFVDKSLDLSLGLLHALLGMGAFAAILWTLSENFDLLGIKIPGLLLWAAIAYSLIGTLLIHWAGRRLPGLDVQQQRAEADFRFSLVRMREQASSVAMMGGAATEAASLKEGFARVLDIWLQVIRRQTGLSVIKRAFGQMSTNVAYLIMAPRYFAGGLPLGVLVQGSSAFQQIDVSLNWIIQNYSDISLWLSAVRRLAEFEAALAPPDEASFRQAQADHGIAAQGLSLESPDGRRLLPAFDCRLEPGQRLLVSGPPGSGKSSLFQAIAGHWFHGQGRIFLPQGGKAMILPQRPYLPIGSLRTILTYPGKPAAYPDERLQAVLHRCHLPNLTACLEDVAHWQQRLSPGEMQKLNIARALLAQPSALLLDEATSALDRQTEAHLYSLLTQELPQTAVISIGHRQDLARWHHQHLDLATQTLVFL